PAVGNAIFFLAISLPLAWRRRAPLAVLGIVASATVIALLAMYDLSEQPPLEPFLALLVAFYSAALYGESGRANLAAALAAAAIVVEEITALIAGRPWGDVVPALTFWAVAWIFGHALRRRQEIATALERRTTDLELEREDTARAAADEERSRIARELHDVIAHGLSVVVVQAAAERRTLSGEQASTRDVLATIERTAREALVELRRLLGMIRKTQGEPALRPHPSLDQLDALLQQVRDAGLQVVLQTEGQASSLPPGIDLSAYRIVQEGLTNVLKHADGASAEVVIRYRPRDLEVEINDDGRGPIGTTNGGHGLIGIRERVDIYGGRLETGPSSSGGFRLWARLPFDSSA
ncbi:MAG: sensor histidine kinase, partial [Actinomycetota bacterium]